VVKHLFAGDLRLHPDDDRFISGSELFEEVRHCGEDQRTVGTGGHESCAEHDGLDACREAEESRGKEASSCERDLCERDVWHFV
jgi:hypothetical protein